MRTAPKIRGAEVLTGFALAEAIPEPAATTAIIVSAATNAARRDHRRLLATRLRMCLPSPMNRLSCTRLRSIHGRIRCKWNAYNRGGLRGLRACGLGRGRI